MADEEKKQDLGIVDMEMLLLTKRYTINPRPDVLKIGLGYFHNIENINNAELAFLNTKGDNKTLLVHGDPVSITLNYDWERGRHDDDHTLDVEQSSYLFRNEEGEVVKVYVTRDASVKEIVPSEQEKERMSLADGLPAGPIKTVVEAVQAKPKPKPAALATPDEFMPLDDDVDPVIPTVTKAVLPSAVEIKNDKANNIEQAQKIAGALTGKTSEDFTRLLTRYEKDGLSPYELAGLKEFAELAQKQAKNETLSKEELVKLGEFQSEAAQSLKPKNIDNVLPAASKLMSIQPLQ